MQRSLYFLSFGMLCNSFLGAESISQPHVDLQGDFVYMQRYHVKNQPLILNTNDPVCKNGCSSNRVLGTNSMIRGWNPGGSVYLSYVPNVKSRYELGGLYLSEMDNTSTRVADGGILSFPFHSATFAKDFYGSQEIKANYKSLVYTMELNYWRTFSASRDSMFSLCGMFGLRFANVSEKFSVDAYKPLTHSSYDIKVKNDLIGLQVGLDFQMHMMQRFYWDLLLKGGVDLNRIAAKVFLGDLNNTVTLRNFKKQMGQNGSFAQAAAGGGYQITDWVKLHVGYQMLFFGGLALAPDQIDYTSNGLHVSATVSPLSLNDNGYILIHGIYTGLTFIY
jgi:hypothetical protein